jgi:hypothetical protein
MFQLKLEKYFIAVGAAHQFLFGRLQEIQSCKKYGTTNLCQGSQITRNDLEETCLGAYYLERWFVIIKLCKLEFTPAKELAFMIAPNKWIIFIAYTFFHLQCSAGQVFYIR